ncbi:GDSL esterase/lipase APG-like isoform X1 [Momordica charantia]|uniref:GDSL esterase/lipase APG-like isoform X1 n=1 Tax=Momordica charantia TaxID=3673 RepID=A0A6J1D4C0_MOMCH|nr:GDSL esterase/lipase APG-like isoform X1 [Momordica charantia]
MLHEFIVFQLNNFIHNGFLQERKEKQTEAKGKNLLPWGFGKLQITELKKMDIISKVLVMFFAFLLGGGNAQESTTLVPAIITFGDSAVDVGNNNYLYTIFKANYPPYGKDFVNHQPTGRFCNGKLATDFTAQTLGFKTFPLPYLSPEATGKNLLIGVNFASAASGYDQNAALLNHALSLPQQVGLFKEYQAKLAKVAGNEKAASIIKDALYLLSAGSGDFLQNYYINPYVNKVYTPDQYGSMLIGAFTTFVKDIYGLGARRLGVTSLPPLGCFPAALTLFGNHQNGCVSRINTDAQAFNKKLNSAAESLKKQLPGFRIVIFDIYKPLYDVISSPSKNGFVEARKGCCGTGTVETTSLLCNPKSLGGTCSNATQYVFWDSVHPSEAANQVLADALILQGFALL